MKLKVLTVNQQRQGLGIVSTYGCIVVRDTDAQQAINSPPPQPTITIIVNDQSVPRKEIDELFQLT